MNFPIQSARDGGAYELVFESPVQSGFWPIFSKTETETGL